MTDFRWGSSTDTGRVRAVNQDNLLVVADRLFALADGMGGHQGGEVASEMALHVLADHLTEYTTGNVLDAVREANRRVHRRASTDAELAGMGTTLCALALVGADGEDGADAEERLVLVNVGDSRVYRRRDEGLEQLTEDHSLVANLVREGRLSDEEAATHPQRNVVTRALGIDTYVKVDSWELDAVTGDRYLLCSDGLFNEVDEARIDATLRRFDDPTDACRELVRLANEGGGRDNITCVVVDVTEGPGLAGRPPLAPTETDLHEPVPPLDDAEGSAGSAATDDTAAMATVAAAGDEGGEDVVADPELGLVEDRLLAEEATAEAHALEHPPEPRRFTWRVLVFALALVGLLATSAAAVAWYGRNTYFVGFDADEVVIFKGRPGGFLWFDPTEEERSGIDRRDVPAGLEDDIESGRDQATLEDAQQFVANLADRIEATSTSTTSTTTSTTVADGGSESGAPPAPPPGAGAAP